MTNFIKKYPLYYTLNQKLDFEIDENQLKEKINNIPVSNIEDANIIFHLIYEHYRFINKINETSIENNILPTWINKVDEDYHINLNYLDIDIKKILWKFLNLKK